ncbi:response regulator [bacterium]|nr:response regulator [bacterium]
MSPDKFRVMVVDDEPDIRSILNASLTPEFEVVEATNGLDAMLKVPKYEPDLAIIDIMMPLMDGLELSRKIREKPGYQDMPIIALSALDSKEDIKKGYGSGANLYLTKPFDPERVAKNVRMSLESRPVRHKTLTIAEIREKEEKSARDLERARARKALEDSRREEEEEREVKLLQEVSAPLPVPEAEEKKTPPSSHVEHISEAKVPKVKDPSGRLLKSYSERRNTPAPEDEDDSPLPFAIPREGNGLIKAPTAAPVVPRVLLVDDDADFLLMIRTALEDIYEVVTAHNGFDALNKIPDTEPDIYIIDGMMPKMSGYQLIDLLHQSMDTHTKPIIFASAKSSPRDRRMVFEKGVTHYLVKPFETEKLLDALNEVSTAPGFQVAEKKKTIKEILYEEGLRREREEHSERRKNRWKTYGDIQKWLTDHKNENPFEKE